jgi:processive 1,2-diacylglycerol beta-glucosyltransferase
MKILITYAATGAGHFKAAEALYSYFKDSCKQIDTRLIGILDKAAPFYRFTCNYGYLFLVKYAPLIWSWLFLLTYNRALRRFIRPILSIINYLNTRDFSRFLIEEKFDFIVSTHFLASEISGQLKKRKKINSKVITVITDFGVHPFWVCEGIDTYIAASTPTRQQLILEGVEEERIKALGIPISQKFLKQYDRFALCKKFGLGQDKFTVLITTGSFGIGPVEEIVDLLYKDAQVLAVCAHNKSLYERLRSKGYPGVYVFGFIDNIQELMAVSDIIIAKPGGLTISESLSMGLFPVFIAAIPGQETENINVLSEYDLGIYIRDAASVKDAILDFKSHPEKLRIRKENIYKIKKTDTLREICNVVCQDSAGPGC